MKCRLLYWPVLLASAAGVGYEAFLERPSFGPFGLACAGLMFSWLGLSDARGIESVRRWPR